LEDFFYIYVLESLKDGKRYVGYTKDLSSRIEAHDKGRVRSTKYRRPLKLIYFEGCMVREDALKREKYLKTFYGGMFIKKRLNSYFTGQVEK